MISTVLNKDLYSFKASLNKIELEYSSLLPLSHYLIITNVTSNKIIYNFACEGYGGYIDGTSLVLETSTSDMLDSDILQIVTYDTGSELEKEAQVTRTQTNIMLKVLTSIDEKLDTTNKYLRKIYSTE